MAESATRKAAARSGSPAGKGNFLPPLRVRYYKKMKRGHVYPITVEWKKAERGVSGKEVTLRLLIAGAQVVPVEQNLDPTDPEDKVTFYVTPLALGKLGNPHLEVVYQGRKVQEMPLPAKAASQFRSWFFLVMAFLVPWLILDYCVYAPLKQGNMTPGQVLNEMIRQNVPDVPQMVKDYVPDADSWLSSARNFVSDGYTLLCETCEDHPVPLYAFGGFLLLAFLSWWWNSDKRRKRMGQPIPIPALGGGRQEEE